MNLLSDKDYTVLSEPLKELENCTICPRNCRANRYSNQLGYCNSDASFNIASICIHKGEEPVISGDKGICNIFFSHCNLQCIYCQNHQISNNQNSYSRYKLELPVIIEKIISILNTGINIVGFVSPSHYIPHIKVIINTLRKIGKNPVFVFNTNAYDKQTTIKELEGYIDVYLPDYKYISNEDSKELSGAYNYPDIAIKAIKEMYHQKGSTLITNSDNNVVSGLIIRHLVLPGYIDKSIALLKNIADEISTSVHISLMSQYYPVINTKEHPLLKNKLTKEDYFRVKKELEKLGFRKGWVQDFESPQNYLPDFNQPNPFSN